MTAIVKKGRQFVREWKFQATQNGSGKWVTSWTKDLAEAREFIDPLASIVARGVGGKVVRVEVRP